MSVSGSQPSLYPSASEGFNISPFTAVGTVWKCPTGDSDTLPYNRSPQPPGADRILVCGLLRTGPHSRRWAVGQQAKLHLPLPIVHITAWTIPPIARITTPPWKNCLPRNRSLVPKRLGTTAYKLFPCPLPHSTPAEFFKVLHSSKACHCRYRKITTQWPGRYLTVLL